MTRSRHVLAALVLILLASCAGPTAAPTPTAFSKTDTNPVTRASEIRFALIGEVTDVNVWALFDSKGYSYNNYAVRNEYWPRLYHLSIPDRNFEPMAASDMPSAVYDDVDYFTATAPLRSDLKWTDGSPFTAEDVAFTVNTALAFRLGFDWRDYYNPDYLDHAEAVDASTVRFFFKKHPNVGVWQYGALQGPIVQKAYWSAKVAEAAASLPPSDLALQIEKLKVKVDDLQQKVNALNLSIASTPMTPDEARQAQAALTRQQGDLNEANNDLVKAQSDYDSAMNAARESLYALDDKDEPTLGNWMPDGEANGVWANKVNPAHPFGEPKFERATYQEFANEDEVSRALKQGDEINIILPNLEAIPDIRLPSGFAFSPYFDNNTYYLVFNIANSEIIDLALRQAIACITWIPNRGNSVSNRNFINWNNQFWLNPTAKAPCTDLGDSSLWKTKERLQLAVQTLKSAGYSWEVEPAWNEKANEGIPGKRLVSPNGKPLPDFLLLSLSKEYDEMESLEAGYKMKMANLLGVSLAVKYVNPEELRYAVFAGHQYDMAILGWRVSEYPGYLCDWFGDGNPFGYHSDRLQSACEALNSTSDLDQARQQVFEIQSILAQDVPFTPLYSGMAYDVYRNITYPFDSVPGGLSGVYGAPSLALPAP